MHAAARGFLDARKLVGERAINAGDAYFELTKEEKVARADALGVDVFIDDLPEILKMPGFPAGMRAILFDPEGHFPDGAGFERHANWASITSALLGKP